MRKKYIIVLMLFTVVPFAIAGDPVKKHPHDLANEKIRDGDYSSAIILSQKALEFEKTAEGYNTLGLSYEKRTQYGMAINAYTNGIKLAPKNNVIQVNRTRAILRELIWKLRTKTLIVFVASVSLLTLIWIAKKVFVMWRKYCIKRKYRHIKIKQIEHLAYDQREQIQPNGDIYYDTHNMDINCILHVPERHDIYPMSVELELQGPRSKFSRKIVQDITLNDKQNHEVKLVFSFDDMAELLEIGGTCRLVATLKPTERVLFVHKINVISEKMLLGNIIVSYKELLAIDNGQVFSDNTIPDDIQSVCSHITICPRNYAPEKYINMTIQALLFSPKSSSAFDSLRIPLDFSKGRQDISLEYPISDMSCDSKVGKWKLHLKVEGEELTSIPFDVFSRKQAYLDFKLSGANLVGTGPKGGVFPLKDISYRRPRTISPLFSFYSEVASQLLFIPVTIGICVDNEPVAEYEDIIQIEGSRIDWMPGEYELPEWEDTREEMEVDFVLFLNRQVIANKSVTIRKRAPYCTDSQGRLSNIRSFQTSHSEVQDILQEALVR